MITQIKLNRIASYKSEVTIDNLKKVNFFFGYNGTGKSTIAKYLYNQSKPIEYRSMDFEYCSLNGLDEDEQEIFVYDTEFVKRNFVNNDKLKGIFSLNEGNEEIENKILLLQSKKENIEKYIETSHSFEQKQDGKITDLEREVLDKCFRKRDSFNTFHKITLQHNRNKKNHYQKINQVRAQLADFESDLEDLSNRYSKYFDEEYTLINEEVNFDLFFQILEVEIELNLLLDEVIIGNKDVNIADIIEKLNISTWVKQGIEYIDEEVCPFCQQNTINEELKNEFSKYFDESYIKKIEKIENKILRYKMLINDLIKNINDIVGEYNEDNMAGLLATNINQRFQDNMSIIDAKLEKPNEKKAITKSFNFYIEFLKINSSILEYNTDVTNIDSHKNSLITDIWKYMAKESISILDKYDDKNNNINLLKQRIRNSRDNQRQKKVALKSEIEELREQVVNTRDAVEKINKILHQTGFSDFSIEENEIDENNITTYYLKRDEEENVFKSLSEGEKNFISFLYFLQSCVGNYERESTKKKIIVIDDPVSSMDSQVLYVVTTLIRELIKRKSNRGNEKKQILNPNIQQVFILSHNAYFYKEVSLKHRICTNKEHHFVRKKEHKTEIESRGDNCFMKSDYLLLWDSLNELKQEDNIQHNITTYNTMRRIIESYSNFLGFHGNSGWGALEEIDESDSNYHICSALISEINDSSHGTYPLENFYFQRISNENPSQLFNAFELIFQYIGKEHYEMMMN